MKKLIVYLLSVLTLTCTTGCGEPPLHRSRQVLMGTFVEVVSPDPRAALIVFAEIRRIERILSKYDPKSEVSRLNKNKEVKASPELLAVLEKARYFWRVTDGAFDVTVAPLVDLWGFTDKKFRQPSKQQIQAVLPAVGMKKIIFKSGNPVVKFMLPETKIDLGAIAKGFAVDCAVAQLKKQGITSCLINAGGDIFCLGSRYGKPWQVAIQDPAKKEFAGRLELINQAVATSGDYEQFFSVGTKRYSHIFNPRTGYPAQAGVASVTVVAGDCLTADALATACLVLGKKKAERLLKSFPGARATIIEYE